MDAVCGEDNWDVLIVEKGGEIVASMPIYIKKKFGSQNGRRFYIHMYL